MAGRRHRNAATCALLVLAGEFRERYRQIKEKLNVLDFADLRGGAGFASRR